jgi:hypothetical protein
LPDAIEGSLYTARIIAHDVDSIIEDVNLTYTVSPNTSWLSIDAATGKLEGTPMQDDIFDTSFIVTVCDKYGACDNKIFFIRVIPKNITSAILTTAGKLHCQIVSSSSKDLYYAKVESVINTVFRYDIYSINGTLLFSSSNLNLTEGVCYLSIDMNKYPDGIYIFVGYENNKIQHPIKFIK